MYKSNKQEVKYDNINYNNNNVIITILQQNHVTYLNKPCQINIREVARRKNRS